MNRKKRKKIYDRYESRIRKKHLKKFKKFFVEQGKRMAKVVERYNSKKDFTKEKANEKEEVTSMIQVGKHAPDFTAPGYQNGKFINVKLSENLGKWILLCFYPGDFTFV